MSHNRSSKEQPTAAAEGARAPKSRILVVDDHPIVREGLVRVIEATADLRVCAQAENIPQAHEAIAILKPDLAIVDLALGCQNGLELIKDIQARPPGPRVLVHSMYDESIYAERCLRAGATGYIMKDDPPARLLSAIRQVLKGEVYLSEAMTKQLLGRIAGQKASQGTSPADRLSDRELEVFELLGRGRGTKEIARFLHLSDKTVQTYREHIKVKLSIKDAVGLVQRAVQWVDSRR